MTEVREIFPHPTVKTVAAEVRFPHLLAIERALPDIQITLLPDYPELRILQQFNVVIGDPTKLTNPESLAAQFRAQGGDQAKSWEFDSKKGVVLRLATNLLNLTSSAHKTYAHDGAPKFRDVIGKAIGAVTKHVAIPFADRVGLRYIDDCALETANDAFRQYWGVPLPLDRFPLPETEAMRLESRVRRGDSALFYQVHIGPPAPQGRMILDYDAYSLNVPTENLMQTFDRLHDIVISEYERDVTTYQVERMRSG